MKKFFLVVLAGCILASINAQDNAKSSASGGLLGAANFSQFRVTGTGTADYNFEPGWSVGGWVNLPVSRGFSLEPQLMYSSYGYHSNADAASVLLKDGKIRYISVPLIFKFNAGDKFAITAGPQIDWFSSFEDRNNLAVEEDFKKTSFSAFGGLEIFPRGGVTIFGRYIFGFSNMDNSDTHGDASKYKNQNIQAGLKFRLFGKKQEAFQATEVAAPIPDSDGDGINDQEDKCPNQAGVAKYNGCPIPDSDGDGINDELDKCPNQAGTAKYNGCPVPDSDGDGINDEQDKCPSEAGPASNNGCPILDKDGDGIPDSEDKCPDIAGTKDNNGCPDVPADVSKLLSMSSQNISFTSNSAKLSTTSNASLNKIVAVLNEHPEMRLKIEGHTDNMEKNADDLSTQRAESVKTYLVSKGISADRIDVEGFGSSMPVTDNNKAKNRRVELKIVY